MASSAENHLKRHHAEAPESLSGWNITRGPFFVPPWFSWCPSPSGPLFSNQPGLQAVEADCTRATAGVDVRGRRCFVSTKNRGLFGFGDGDAAKDRNLLRSAKIGCQKKTKRCQTSHHFGPSVLDGNCMPLWPSKSALISSEALKLPGFVPQDGQCWSFWCSCCVLHWRLVPRRTGNDGDSARKNRHFYTFFNKRAMAKNAQPHT